MKHIIALSGGKDSTAMALRLKELNPTTRYEYVCTPTGDELPEMQKHWDTLETLLGEIKKLPVLSLYELIEQEQMIPNFRARFCTRILKIEPFFAYMESQPEGSIMYVGLRADEEDRVGAQIDKEDKFTMSAPMRDWGWGLKEVTDFLFCRGITIPARTDCGACFYQRLDEWWSLWSLYPERYEKYKAIEKQIGHTFRSNGRDTWPAGLAELEEEFRKGRKLRVRRKSNETGPACPWCSK